MLLGQDLPSAGSGTPPGNFDIPTTIVLVSAAQRLDKREEVD
jgi:hypothetical protein